MSATSVTQMTIDLATKTTTFSSVLALREYVGVTLTGATGSDAAGLILRISDANGVEVAICDSFSASGDDFVGTLQLDGDALAGHFTFDTANKFHRFTLQVVNVTSGSLSVLINDFVPIMNNPFTALMEAAI